MYIHAPGPVPALHTVAKHGAQSGEGNLFAQTVIFPEYRADVLEDEDVVEDAVEVETVVLDVAVEVEVVEDNSVDVVVTCEVDESAGEDDAVSIGVASVVETKVMLPERNDAKSGENWSANIKIAIRVRALRTRILLSEFTWASFVYHV